MLQKLLELELYSPKEREGFDGAQGGDGQGRNHPGPSLAVKSLYIFSDTFNNIRTLVGGGSFINVKHISKVTRDDCL